MKLPSFTMADWLRQTGDLPLDSEARYLGAPISFAKHIVKASHHVTPLKFANLPGFKTWIFLHIPKTAGTSFFETARARNDLVTVPVSRLIHTPTPQRRLLLRRAIKTRNIILHGHVHAKYWRQYIKWTGRERAFTFLRDPVDIQLSNVNFIMGRISAIVGAKHFDGKAFDRMTRAWRQRFEQNKFSAAANNVDAAASWTAMVERPFEPSTAWALELMRSEPYVHMYSRMIEKFLGAAGEPQSVAEIIAFVKRLGVNVVRIEDASAFTKQHFGFELPKGVNARRLDLVGRADLEPDVIGKLLGQDAELYEQLLPLAWRQSPGGALRKAEGMNAIRLEFARRVRRG